MWPNLRETGRRHHTAAAPCSPTRTRSALARRRDDPRRTRADRNRRRAGGVRQVPGLRARASRRTRRSTCRRCRHGFLHPWRRLHRLRVRRHLCRPGPAEVTITSAATSTSCAASTRTCASHLRAEDVSGAASESRPRRRSRRSRRPAAPSRCISRAARRITVDTVIVRDRPGPQCLRPRTRCGRRQAGRQWRDRGRRVPSRPTSACRTSTRSATSPTGSTSRRWRSARATPSPTPCSATARHQGRPRPCGDRGVFSPRGPVGVVRLTETQARERGHRHARPIDLRRAPPFRPMKATLFGPRYARADEARGREGTGGRVLGCHIVGEGAAEMVQMARRSP